MTKRLSAIATLAALALVAVWVLPAAATPASGFFGAGHIVAGTQGTCADDGRGDVWGHSGNGAGMDGDTGFYQLGMVGTAADLSYASLELCGELSRTPSGSTEAALGAACARDVWAPGGDFYYGRNGRGLLRMDMITGQQRVVRIRNVTWAPSVTGRLIAFGEYADDPLAPLATQGTFAMQVGAWVSTACWNYGWQGADASWGSFELIPTEA